MSFSLNIIRQSAAEVLAYALLDLFPGVELIGGNVTEIGFYYDFQIEQVFDDHMLPLIEEKMRALIKEEKPIKELTMMRENAISFFTHRKQFLIADRLKLVLDNMVPIFKMGEFHDYCSTPYVESSKDVGAIKLFDISQMDHGIRIEGTAFADSYALKKFLKKIEGYKKRDHRILGKEIQFFGSSPLASHELFWLPKGMFVRDFIKNLWKEEIDRRKIQILSTSQIVSTSLLKKIGFFQFSHKKSPVIEIDGDSYHLSPSYAYSQALVYLSQSRQFQEFPLRFTEWKESYESEKSDRLWGMLKSRSFTADRGVIFCTAKQVVKEIISSLQFIKKTINMFAFEHRWYLRTKAKKSAGNSQQWQESTYWITEALKECSIDYTIDEDKFAYSGPYLEVRLLDTLGREWKGAYLSIDLNQPERLSLSYLDGLGEKQIPVMITQSLVGSLERFVALLIERYEGNFPLWLAPEQVKVLPIGERFEYAESIKERLTQEGFRVDIDYRKEPLGNKVHAAELEKVPYMLIVGEKEEKNCSLSIRSTSQNQTNGGTKIEAFLELLKKGSAQAGDRKSFES